MFEWRYSILKDGEIRKNVRNSEVEDPVLHAFFLKNCHLAIVLDTGHEVKIQENFGSMSHCV